MTTATKTQTISIESAAETAHQLSAVLINPDCPSDLYKAIGAVDLCARQ